MTDQDPIESQPTPETPEVPETPETPVLGSLEPTMSERITEDTPPPGDEQEAAAISEQMSEPEKAEEKAPEKKPPTKFQLILRKVLIALVIVALFFLGGFLTDHFVRYKPLADELDQTRAALEDVNQAVSDLEAENATLKKDNRTAQDQIAALEEELSAVRANALFYQVLMDVNASRIMLFMEDIEGAQAALVNTQAQLEDLLPAIEDVNEDLALSLPVRLELIVSGLVRNPETGMIDLELFTKDLLELEPLLNVE